MSVETLMWIILVINILGLWHLSGKIEKVMRLFFHMQDEIGYIQTKLGIDQDTKDLMDKVEMARMER